VSCKYLTTNELAERLRTSPETIRYWRHTGRGPKSWKPGRKVLYELGDVIAWETEERAKAGGGDRAA